MKQKFLTDVSSRKMGLLALFASGTILAGCEDAGPGFLKPSSGDTPNISSETPTAEAVETEVERPDIFKANESALWDGRPSLGGIWVAAPGVKDPERVVITNTENGRSIAGALFRRERNNPGPRLQLSSDAAVALGVLAGKPTKIGVVVVRTEIVKPEPAAAPEPVATPETAPETVAAAAEAPKRKPTPPTPATDGPSDPTVAIPLSEPEATGSPSSLPGLFAPRAAQASETDAAPEADLIATEDLPETLSEPLPDGPSDPVVAAPEPELTGSPGSGLFSRRSKQPDSTAEEDISDAALGAPLDATTPAIETAPVTTSTLDPIAAATAAIERSETQASDAPTRAATPNPTASTLAKPYIQIGLYSIQGNADATQRRLSSAGVLATVLKEENAGTSMWRVVVGPSRTSSERRVLRSKMRDLGYKDAYYVTR